VKGAGHRAKGKRLIADGKKCIIYYRLPITIGKAMSKQVKNTDK
jgi:hypothetical protein